MKKVILLIPLTFNDGTAVPDEKLKTIEHEIYNEFNCWTVVGEVTGAFRLQSGKKQVDRLLHVWVLADESALPKLRQMVGGFGKLLEQEAMYFELGGGEIELIPPPSQEG